MFVREMGFAEHGDEPGAIGLFETTDQSLGHHLVSQFEALGSAARRDIQSENLHTTIAGLPEQRLQAAPAIPPLFRKVNPPTQLLLVDLPPKKCVEMKLISRMDRLEP